MNQPLKRRNLMYLQKIYFSNDGIQIGGILESTYHNSCLNNNLSSTSVKVSEMQLNRLLHMHLAGNISKSRCFGRGLGGSISRHST